MGSFGHVCCFVACLTVMANAFVLPSARLAPEAPRFAATLDETDATNVTPPKPRTTIKNIEYGEQSRKYRRTVYSHDDWRKHRQTDRFLYYLSAIFSSGIYKNLAREVTATTAIATGVCLYNALVGGCVDFTGVQHDAILINPFLSPAGLALVPFSLCTSSLGLLLVFRTNTSYQRWDETRKNWGMNINHTRDLVRMGNAYYDSTGVSEERRAADLNMLALCTWAFVRSMKRHLSPEDEDENAFRVELYEKVPFDQARGIIEATHRPNRALQDLSVAIENLPMHFLRKQKMHQALSIFEDDLGSCERLLTSPVPLFYSRHTARFLSVWLLLLPFALYDSCAGSWNHIAMIPITAVISVFLFGIDEIATQLEESFTILPMQALCDKIYNWCFEIVSWQPGDNGMVIHAPLPQHNIMSTRDASTTRSADLKLASVPLSETLVVGEALSLETLNQPFETKPTIPAPSIGEGEAFINPSSFGYELVEGETDVESIGDVATDSAKPPVESFALTETKVNVAQKQEQINPVNKAVDSSNTTVVAVGEETLPLVSTNTKDKAVPTVSHGQKENATLKPEPREAVDKRQVIADRVANRRKMLKEMHSKVQADSMAASKVVVANKSSNLGDAPEGPTSTQATTEEQVVSSDLEEVLTDSTATKQAESPTAPELVVAGVDDDNSNVSDAVVSPTQATTEEQVVVSSDVEEESAASTTTNLSDSSTAPELVVAEIETSQVTDAAKAKKQTANLASQAQASTPVSNQDDIVAQETTSVVSDDTPNVSKRKFLSQLKATQPTPRQDTTDVPTPSKASTTTTKPKFLSQLKPKTSLPSRAKEDS